MAETKKKKKKQQSSDEDEDETFYHRYASAPQPQQQQQPGPNQTWSGPGPKTLAPSKSTLYVANLDFSLTNSDLHTLFSRFGKIARVTVLKDRQTRRSRGVAFIQFVTRDDAVAAASEMHGKILNGRKLSASIAADNGRAAEFIKKREYGDKSRCYECGEEGHLSYECPKNQLGPRERPEPKRLRRGGGGGRGGGGAAARGEEDEEGDGEGFEYWAVDEDRRLLMPAEVVPEKVEKKKKKKKVENYFSDDDVAYEDDDE